MTAVHPTNPDRVYFTRPRDVAISPDGGSSLTVSAPVPGDGAEPISLYVDAAGAIYAGTIEQGAFVSHDNGASWTAWGLNTPAPRAVMKIAYSPAAGGTFFMATTSGLYRKLQSRLRARGPLSESNLLKSPSPAPGRGGRG